MNVNLLHPTRSRIATVPSFAEAPQGFEFTKTADLKEFGKLSLRPIRIEDEPLMIHFHESLSEDSIYFRYFEHIAFWARILHERLAAVCANTADSTAIVAVTSETPEKPGQIVAVGRLTTTESPYAAAFAMLMNDKAQNSDIPTVMLKRLIEIARGYGFHMLTGELLVSDHDTTNLCRSLGFAFQTIPEDSIVRVTLPL